MIIRPVEPTDAEAWLRMRMALWSDSSPEKEAGEIAHFFDVLPRPPLPMLHAAFVCSGMGAGELAGGLCGLVEVSIRPTALGCATESVGYLEAWYVDPAWRGRGVGRALVQRAEAWARQQGCREMASDTTPDYPLSPAAHAALGYETVGFQGEEQCFRKDLTRTP